MSRTDKTKPFWVKLMHGDLSVEELHDHSEGPCDLPAPNVPESYWYGPSTSKCRRTFVYTGTHTCCCHLCHSCDEYMVRPGKRQRLDGKKACRDWRNEY